LGNPTIPPIPDRYRFFTAPSSLAFQAFSTLLNHPTFVPEFLKLSCTRLVEYYAICTRFLREYSIPYNPTNAGFFIWIDLSAYLKAMPGHTDLEKEREMNRKLLDNGIHLATSEQFYGEDYGWFRITFAVEKDVLELGMIRFEIIKLI
jgi:1-aminocyclopropane-1-carboxylate synthase